MEVVSFTLRPLYAREKDPDSNWTDGSQNTGWFRGEKSIFSLLDIQMRLKSLPLVIGAAVVTGAAVATGAAVVIGAAVVTGVAVVTGAAVVIGADVVIGAAVAIAAAVVTGAAVVIGAE
jgi:NDP-sugar pyrophosphorylase family protein